MQFYVLSTLFIYNEFRNICMWLSCLTGGIHIYIFHKFESNESMLSQVIFYLKSVNFLFVQYIINLITHHANMSVRFIPPLHPIFI